MFRISGYCDDVVHRRKRHVLRAGVSDGEVFQVSIGIAHGVVQEEERVELGCILALVLATYIDEQKLRQVFQRA
jgi:hypothetical protein